MKVLMTSFTKWGKVIVFVSISVKLFQRRGLCKGITNLAALTYILG